MSDLIDDPQEGENAPEFTVTEISGAVKRTIEGSFSRVRVRGELGRVSRPRSGHVYLDLKDDKSVLSGVIWKGVANRLATQPEEGLEVVATGRLTTFGGQSKYQMVIEDLTPAGMGALMAMLEKRKKAFAAEGLFDAARKQRLPYLPEVIGVVTSPSGAVIRDILHRLRDRFPRRVLIWPVAVQGQKCAPEVARAIAGFNALTPGGAVPRPDLLIVARGGGSVEDLWGFNEEAVVRAVAASDIPIISAVGHETDTTLIDYVADQRAPTPTAAAELAVPVRLELISVVDELGARSRRALVQGITQRRDRTRDLARILPKPEQLVENARQRLDTLADRLPKALASVTQRRQVALSRIAGGLRPTTLQRRLQTERRRADELGRRLGPALLRGRDRLVQENRRSRENLVGFYARFHRAATGQISTWKTLLSGAERLRQTLGYKETLKRGYAVVREAGQVITRRKDAAQAQALEIEFHDGRVAVGGHATSGVSRPSMAASAAAKPKKTKPAKGQADKDQGRLF